MASGEQQRLNLDDYDERNKSGAATSASAEPGGNRRQHQLRMLKLRQLEPSPDHPRHVIDEDDVASLVESMRENGMAKPIVVTSTPNSRRYTIIDGLLRFHAAQRLGLEDVPAHVVNCKDSRVLRLLLDLTHKPLHPVDLADSVVEAASHLGGGTAALGDITGRSDAEISRSRRIAALSPVVKAVAREKAISFSVVYELSDVAFDDQTRLRLLERPEKLSTDLLRAEARRRQSKPPTRPAVAAAEALLKAMDQVVRWLKTDNGDGETSDPRDLTLRQVIDRLKAFVQRRPRSP